MNKPGPDVASNIQMRFCRMLRGLVRLWTVCAVVVRRLVFVCRTRDSEGGGRERREPMWAVCCWSSVKVVEECWAV